MAARFATLDHLASCPDEVRGRLELIQRITREVLPKAGERIGYGIPTVPSRPAVRRLLPGWHRHVAIYPVPGGDDAPACDLTPYRAGKGALRFSARPPAPGGPGTASGRRLAGARAGSGA